VLPRQVRSIGVQLQHQMNCGDPSDQRLFTGYIRGVRVTATWGATCITAENHLQAYFDLWEMVCVSSTGTIVTDAFPLGLVWF